MALHTSVRQGCLVVQMPPEVDIGNAEPLRWELRAVCRALLDRASRDGVSAVVVDWAAAPFLTMAGVAVLEDFRQRVDAGGVPLRLVASRRVVRAVLRIVGLNDVLAIHDTVEQALAGGKISGRGEGEGRGRPEIGRTS
ncbi:STAS domain-containing protein [Streptomyces sp. NPDC056486]|uniref:STAS domain-containing protein n=1 Tax=Streptomyces sp. NPDC056486 TaxID=3345835 RepID=UPI00367C927B